MSDDAREIYAERQGVRASFGGDLDGATAYARRYTAFVQEVAPPPGRLLDVGCGAGWSTLAFRDAGYDAIGLDLPASPEVHQVDATVPYRQGDAAELPFGEASFDVVAMHQALEHMPDPRRVLEEARRVLKQGGTLVVVGPNLESPAAAARFALRLLTGARTVRRTPGMPRHPYGNTIPETLVALGRSSRALVASLTRRAPRFEARTPDLRPPFHADNDATWFCNPSDLLAWARLSGMRPRRWWSGRPLARVWWRLAAGTWVALERS